MRSRKVDPLLLQKLYEQGMSGVEIARELGVSKGAVSKNLKALGRAKAQDLTLRCAEKINNKRLSAMERLNRAAKVIEIELDHIQKEVPRAQGEERKQLIASQLAHVAETRKQVSTLIDVAKVFYSIEDVREFQRIILQVIGEVDKGIRDEVIKRLREKRSLRSVLGGDGFQV